MNKPCEYCSEDLPEGVDKRTRQIRSYHFKNCWKRLELKRVEEEAEAVEQVDEIERLTFELSESERRWENACEKAAELKQRLAKIEAALDMYRRQIRAMDEALSKGRDVEAFVLIRHAAMFAPIEKFALKDSLKKERERCANIVRHNHLSARELADMICALEDE